MSIDLKPLGRALSAPQGSSTPEASDAISHVPASLRAEAEAAASFAQEQHAAATRTAYASDFQIFMAWCESRGISALPALAATVATFIAAQAQEGVKPSTLSRRVAAIRYRHAAGGLASPTKAEVVKATLKGIRRARSVAPQRKAPATAERVIQMVGFAPNTLCGARDRALLLLGFAGAFRRSELAALDVRDFEFVAEGLRVTIRRSKTDQEGAGQTVAIVRGAQTCPVTALRAWLDAAGITEGSVFRPVAKGGRVLNSALTPHSMGLIVKRYAARAGFNAADFGAHSLRAGFLTSAAMRGASIFKMMDVSRHKSVDTLRGYVRDANAFKDHAGSGLL